ncbi:HTH-type transcriptional regulator HdfR [Alphaproteobacteria bacterium SO-S41]|nr:HTH-type transcriptional regulator HdfR [Alphaproteobacteria bacterium SO-S41]
MPIDPKLLAPLLEAGRTQSFTKAAHQLGISQPRLSLLIKKLEDQLGFALFTRAHRSVALTPEGKVVFDKAAAVSTALREFDEAVWRVRGEKRSRLRLGSPRYQVDIPERNTLIRELSERRPNLQIEINGARTPSILNHLRAGTLDLALVTAPFETSDLVAKPFARARAVLVFPQNDPFAKLDSIPVGKVKGKSIAIYPRTIGMQFFDAWYASIRDAGAVLVEAQEDHVSALIHFAAHRRIATVVHLWSNQDSLPVKADIGMAFRPIVGGDLDLKVYMVKLRSNHSPIVDWVWNLADQFSDTSGFDAPP